MVGAKKCVRCGCMYIAENEVCEKCQAKDGADLHRLKGIIQNPGYEGMTQGELAIVARITNKNLERFLGYEEFQGVCLGQKTIAASGTGLEGSMEFI